MITKLPSYIFIFLILIGCFSRDLEIIEEKLIEYTLTIIESEGGIIDSTGGKYSSGENITLTALPNPGYVFSEWMGINSNENPLTVKVDSDHNILAIFIKFD